MMGTSTELSTTIRGQRRRGSLLSGLASFGALLCAVGSGLGCGGATDGPQCEGLAQCPPDPEPEPCTRNGSVYANGASLPAGDGCNTCTCSAGGWNCTTVGCLGDACVYGGQIRADGSSFPASDGCNQCSCSDGAVACTERACVPSACNHDGMLLPNGASAPSGDGCNSCTCIAGELACTLIDCRGNCYSNSDCGDAQYCELPIGTCSEPPASAADAETEELRAPTGQDPRPAGECRDRPTLCTDEEAPVCGCDRQTYRTACAAASLGLNLVQTGACFQPE